MASVFCLVTRAARFYRPRVYKKQQQFLRSLPNSHLSSAVDLAENHETNSQSFASLFEKSQFARIQDPVGKKVEAEVIAVVENKLYVDFGCKFHAVVDKPEKDKETFVEGSKVVVVVKDLEMSMHPLGSSKDLSLLEADVELCT